MGLTPGVIQARSQNQRKPHAPTFEERSIEGTLSMEKKARKSAWVSHKNAHAIAGSYSGNRHRFFKPQVPRGMFLSLSRTTSKERELIVDSGASLHMMSKRDLTPEELETIQMSKGPSVIMTANGTTHTTEEATLYVCDLDMSVQVQSFKESPAILSLGV